MVGLECGTRTAKRSRCSDEFGGITVRPDDGSIVDDLLRQSQSTLWGDRAQAASVLRKYFDRPNVRARLIEMFTDADLAVSEAVAQSIVAGGGRDGLLLVLELQVANRENVQLSEHIRDELFDMNNRGVEPIKRYCAEIEALGASDDIRAELDDLRPWLAP